MIIDRTHRVWIVVTFGLWIVSTLLYGVYARAAPDGPRGGSWQGLTFGVAGSLLMIFAGLLAAQKRVPRLQTGGTRFWLKGHIWLGLLSVPLILFHSGFRVGGLLEQLLMATYAIVILSGVVGLGLQQVLPKLIKEVVPTEAVYEQIPVLCRRLRESTERSVQAACGDVMAVVAQAQERRERDVRQTYSPERELAVFYVDEVRPFLSPEDWEQSPLANHTRALARISRLQNALPYRLHHVLEEIGAVCQERRQLLTQQRFHYWLHVWLIVHVPLSMALLVLGVMHAVMSVRY